MGETEGRDNPSRGGVREPTPCLMLVPRGFDAPLELIEGMRERGVRMQEVGDAPAVMVALARRRYLSVVIVEPFAVLELEQLLEAISRYHGPVPVWQYVADEKPRLSRLSQRPAPRRQSPRTADAEVAAVATPPRQRQTQPEPTVSPDVAGRIRPSRSSAGGWRDRRKHAAMEAESPAPADRTPREPEHEEESPFDPPQVRVTLSEEELAMLLDEDYDAGGGSGLGDEESRR